jgi:hypothetical protein
MIMEGMLIAIIIASTVTVKTGSEMRKHKQDCFDAGGEMFLTEGVFPTDGKCYVELPADKFNRGD